MQSDKILMHKRKLSEAGFTLVELMVAAAIFLVVGGAAFSLFAQHQPLFNQQQNLAEVNISLRNAIAQMQLDVANAGANYYTGVNVPNYPVGVVVTNNAVASGGDCRSGTPLAYGVNCFDSLSIITADAATPPANPTTSTGTCIDTSAATSGANGTAYLAPAGSVSGYGTTQSVATTAAGHYISGDQILFVNTSGSPYTTAVLKANGGTAKIGTNWYVLLTYGVTAADGTNTATNDPYNMTTHANSLVDNSYCSSDYVLRLLPITYSVDITTDPTNPTLIRSVAGTTQTTAQKTLATQIVGFKIGASLFNSTTDTDSTTYCFDSKKYDSNCPGIADGSTGAWAYNYTLVRSLMVSIIGRTKPATAATYVFRNTFDSGAYEIQGVTTVINPRNMSMAD